TGSITWAARPRPALFLLALCLLGELSCLVRVKSVPSNMAGCICVRGLPTVGGWAALFVLPSSTEDNMDNTTLLILIIVILLLTVIEVDESEEITVAVRADDLLEGNTADPERHPIAIALRRQDDVDDARVTKNETLVRRGKKWFRYDAPDKRLFKQLQKTLTAT